MSNAFAAYMTAKDRAMQQGANALAMGQVAEKIQRDRKLRDILAGAYKEPTPEIPLEGPTPTGEALAPVPAQPGRMDIPGTIGKMYTAGLGPEAMQMQMALQKTDRDKAFTLKPGEVRYGPRGSVIAERPLETFAETDQLAPWRGIGDPKKKAEAKIRWGIKADTQMGKMMKEADISTETNRDIDRFLALNETTETGPISGMWGISGVRRAADPEFQEMSSISDKLTPRMRQGMPGAASDRDVAMFRGATVGVEKDYEANKKIGFGLKVANQNKIDRTAFFQQYLDQRGHLRGAKKEWDTYLEANPIFDPTQPESAYELNTTRLSYDQWVNAGKPVKPVKTAPQSALDYLKANNNPAARKQFKSKYGYLP